jgi:hypothetical protein
MSRHDHFYRQAATPKAYQGHQALELEAVQAYRRLRLVDLGSLVTSVVGPTL